MKPGLRAALLLVLAAGAVLRIHAFVLNPPLWIDEAALALNIVSRTAGELLRPLDFEQTAPPLFLAAAWLAVAALGVNEPALRLVPLLAALALPFAFWPLCRRCLESGGALAAAAFLAASPLLVRYAAEVKPFALDALASAALIALALDCASHPEVKRHWWRLGLGGVVALGASLGAPFVVAGVLIALAISRNVRPWSRRLVALTAVWAASAAALALGLYASTFQSSFMRAVHGATAEHPVAAVHFLGVAALGGTATRPMDGVALAAAVVAAAGLIRLGRRFGAAAPVLLVVPTVLGLGAALADFYGSAPRMFLFALPPLALALGAGLDSFAERWPRAPAVGAFLLVVPGAFTLAAFQPEGGGRALATLHQRERVAGEPVYVAARGLTAWVFYTTDWSAPDRGRLAFVSSIAGRAGAVAYENAASRGPRTTAEGRELQRVSDGRLEIFGVSTGRQWRYLKGFLTAEPDPGWAETEAERIVRAGGPGVWLFFTMTYDGADQALCRALEAHGARLASSAAERGARLYHFVYGPAPADLQSAKPGQPSGEPVR